MPRRRSVRPPFAPRRNSERPTSPTVSNRWHKTIRHRRYASWLNTIWRHGKRHKHSRLIDWLEAGSLGFFGTYFPVVLNLERRGLSKDMPRSSPRFHILVDLLAKGL